MKISFGNEQRLHQIAWRKANITSESWGYQHGRFNKVGKENKRYEHIIPKHLWNQTLWAGIQKELPDYLGTEIKPHSGTHNLLSSWVVCANLYFPVRINPEFSTLMLEFLQQKVSSDIIEVTGVELEFAYNDDLGPANLLGELDGSRGSGQTSPDVAFLVKTKNGSGIILTECKYTEHSFYPCSARTTKDSERRLRNPDPGRCMNPATVVDYKSICHQSTWGRKYWNHLHLSELGINTLKYCPASTSGYQLFRQQSLAEGISKSGRFALVASSVAFDGRNTELIGCLKNTGITDFQTDWVQIFEGNTIFKTWTHQEWVDFVRTRNGNPEWLKYVKERYGY